MRALTIRWVLVAAMPPSSFVADEDGKAYEIVLDRHVEVGATRRAVSSGANLEQPVVTVDGRGLRPKERRRVDDSWPIDAARAAEWFSDPGMTIEKVGFSGETRLTEAGNVDGDEAITVEARVTMEEIVVAMPEGFQLVEGRLDARFTGTFPVDLRRAKLEESLTEVGTAGRSGCPVVMIKATGTRTRTTKFAARRSRRAVSENRNSHPGST